MTTLAIQDLSRQTGHLSRPLRNNEEVTLTYHGKPLARAVPVEQLEQERAELARLRELVVAHGIAA
ncbi:antitoxin (DNA-binding transcriptional repressor) of toxin-antitoxin stability system [Lentzea atacamensis]|uniref:Antitoxin (DNA-binding transcriptional repressor) of toxin-antitoxin stability system n=1 Tax=Lentzea atacamensis TaxID=531938 RepID=A0ABX9DXQ3_9PSEU|nr:type II toxin-antitoxin system Phd/YefM family antitoxin [Lentzea atacamensis]RAS57823.1 antitoxin (DNA-binding transcriptional repressor) of toxin-antitoxin stability system [Lentzea atacamensis]